MNISFICLNRIRASEKNEISPDEKIWRLPQIPGNSTVVCKVGTKCVCWREQPRDSY